jgi:hypothetical protein
LLSFQGERSQAEDEETRSSDEQILRTVAELPEIKEDGNPAENVTNSISAETVDDETVASSAEINENTEETIPSAPCEDSLPEATQKQEHAAEEDAKTECDEDKQCKDEEATETSESMVTASEGSDPMCASQKSNEEAQSEMGNEQQGIINADTVQTETEVAEVEESAVMDSDGQIVPSAPLEEQTMESPHCTEMEQIRAPLQSEQG